MALLQAPWFAALLGCLLYLATTVVFFKPGQLLPAVKHLTEAEKLAPGDDPSWKFRNPEFEQWVEELKRERENLAVKRQQLDELKAQLDTERLEILTVTQSVHQLQLAFDSEVVRFKTQETENARRQSKIIAGMTPEGAALMLNEMPDTEVVRILYTLKPDIASGILDAFSKMGPTQAKKAADLADKIRKVLPNNGKDSKGSATA
jgi:flagellar motility protein MotE (MotC chaperone)